MGIRPNTLKYFHQSTKSTTEEHLTTMKVFCPPEGRMPASAVKKPGGDRPTGAMGGTKEHLKTFLPDRRKSQ